jgi:hypothetical protein
VCRPAGHRAATLAVARLRCIDKSKSEAGAVQSLFYGGNAQGGSEKRADYRCAQPEDERKIHTASLLMTVFVFYISYLDCFSP